jgi:hypothetical protein
MSRPIEFDYDIRIVGGQRGKDLTQAQARSILEVVEWFSRTQQQADTTAEPSNEDSVTDRKRYRRPHSLYSDHSPEARVPGPRSGLGYPIEDDQPVR